MIKVLYIMTHATKSGPIQQMLNLIVNLDPTIFKAKLITVYEEDERLSVLQQYLNVIEHEMIPTTKKQMMFGSIKNMRKAIQEFGPDVIHSFGVFPDYMVYRLGFKNHVFTCRNYVYDDYPDEYGKILGTVLAKIHLKAIKHTKNVRVCSESLHDIYLKRLGLDIPFIRNGVDVSKFSFHTETEKYQVRNSLGLSAEKIVCIYAGPFNGRKNQSFLLESIIHNKSFQKLQIVLPGDGEELEKLKKEYESNTNVIFPGQVFNMPEYLAASDIYLSTSKSEGMPNGVLEAMSIGLPVILSDIEQHCEVLSVGERCGLLYACNDSKSFNKALDKMLNADFSSLGENASKNARKYFSATSMSENYQSLYLQIYQNS